MGVTDALTPTILDGRQTSVWKAGEDILITPFDSERYHMINKHNFMARKNKHGGADTGTLPKGDPNFHRTSYTDELFRTIKKAMSKQARRQVIARQK
jgi:hypothetical protein